MRHQLAIVCTVLAVAVAGCSSGSGPTKAEQEYAAATPEIPRTGNDFERTCTDGLGFPGLPAYEKKAGQVHPAAFVYKRKGDWFEGSYTSTDLPQDWVVKADTLAKAELVVCIEPTADRPTARICDMESSKTGEKWKMTVHSVDWKVRVMDAKTGKVVHEKTGTKSENDCPYMTYQSKGDDKTKYVPSLDDKLIRPVVKPFVAP